MQLYDQHTLKHTYLQLLDNTVVLFCKAFDWNLLLRVEVVIKEVLNNSLFVH